MTEIQKEATLNALALFEKSRADLLAELSVSILIGSPFMIIATCVDPEDGRERELVYGHWTKAASGYGWVYEPAAVGAFVCLSVLPDHLCGVSCFSPDGGERCAEQVRKDPSMIGLKKVELRHIRDEKKRRLESANKMVAFFREALEKA